MGGGGEEVHVFRDPPVGDEGHQAPVAVVGEGEAGLLPHLPEQAVLGALLVLELSANADPFVVVEVVFLFLTRWSIRYCPSRSI